MKTKLNKLSRGHYRVMNMTNLPIPEDEGEQIQWCEGIVNQLETRDDVETLYTHRSAKKGFLVASYKMDDYFYLVCSIKTEYKLVEITDIYLMDSQNDCINVAKFLASNIVTIMQDYASQLKEAEEGAKKLNSIS